MKDCKMINDIDEEGLLLDQLKGARWKVEQIKKEITLLAIDKSEAEYSLEVIEQAIVDYMQGNGLVKFANCTLGQSEVVDIADEKAVPKEYLREKISYEPNKIKIKDERPDANWYSIKERHFIKLTTTQG